ncbi:DeoR/GlpR family DNA-binding transcription regulator [Halodesulfurarchaeum formicicum]|nr:hypothetical protein [Halodesulfurarchaeum formicicum]
MSRKQKHGGSTTERPVDTGGRGRGRGGDRRGRGDRSRRRNDRGQYVEQMTESEILALLDRIPGPVIATTDVAEHFDSTTEGARRKLNDLCDAGVLDRRKVGGTRVYWRAGPEEKP